jgi:hypothetical protein
MVCNHYALLAALVTQVFGSEKLATKRRREYARDTSDPKHREEIL